MDQEVGGAGMRAQIFFAAGMVVASQPLAADCGYCAREVTLSEQLATCYLQQMETERRRALELELDIHLINLAACADNDATRGANPMPELKRSGGDDTAVPLDQSFLIPIAAMDCLAEALRDEDFDPEKVKTFEVRVDCEE